MSCGCGGSLTVPYDDAAVTPPHHREISQADQSFIKQRLLSMNLDGFVTVRASGRSDIRHKTRRRTLPFQNGRLTEPRVNAVDRLEQRQRDKTYKAAESENHGWLDEGHHAR